MNTRKNLLFRTLAIVLNHKFFLRNAQQYQAIAKTVYGACPHDMRRTVESITSFFGSKSTEK